MLVNGFLSDSIEINRSVRQGCPVAPLLYVCVIETLLIEIRTCPIIHGIKSPTSNDGLLLSAFADDSGFYADGVPSAIQVINKFDSSGMASSSGFWL